MDATRGFHASSLRAIGAFATSLILACLSGPAAATVDPVIRCPDWQRHAPPVRLADASAGQTRRDFETRSSPPGGSAAAVDPSIVQSTAAAVCPTHTVRSGDTLSGIAAARLGSAGRWGEIAAANGGLDPVRLRVGAVLDIPCGDSGATAGNGRLAADGGPPPAASGGFLARLFGIARTPPADPGDTSGNGRAGQGTHPPSDAAVPEPKPPPPVWQARKGEYFADVLRRWGGEAGYTVIADSVDVWRLGVPVRIRAAFEDAVAELVRGLGHGGVAPRVRIHPNGVIRLGGPV